MLNREVQWDESGRQRDRRKERERLNNKIKIFGIKIGVEAYTDVTRVVDF